MKIFLLDYTIMQAVQESLTRFYKTLPMDNKSMVIYSLVVLSIIFFISLMVFKRDHFEELYAEYPSVFDVKIPSSMKDIVYDNHAVKVVMNAMSINQGTHELELPSHSTMVPVSIGNGLAANVMVKVPAQISSVPVNVPVVDMKTQESASAKTDVLIAARQANIPAQSGCIPAKIDGTDEMVMVPVNIPSQMVKIVEQTAFVPGKDTFKMM